MSKILMMAGGTGGHVIPALAVAKAFQEKGVEIEWLGTAEKIEARIVPEAGFIIHFLSISGVRGKGVLAKLLAPFQLIRAVVQARSVIKRVKPDVVMGFGGFASGPGGLAAMLNRLPLYIHEQNAVAGMTNKSLARLTDKLFAAFPNVLDGAMVVGNPVRKEILNIEAPESRYDQRQGVIKILVIGGSLGARALNEIVPAALGLMNDVSRPAVRHQAGKTTFDLAQNNYDNAGVKVQVEAFISDMSSAYADADLVICRAGALTVSEIAAAGVAAFFVPFPYAVDDHQTKNAEFLVRTGAAQLVQERDLTPEKLAGILETLDRETLKRMAIKAKEQAKLDAAQKICETVFAELNVVAA